jgi:hypothetical protein
MSRISFLTKSIFYILFSSMVCHATIPLVPIEKKSVTSKKFVRKTSFKESWSRYPSPNSIINNLAGHFPLADQSRLSRDCRGLTVDNRSFLGDSDPVSGSPTIESPNSTFVNWYLNCISEFIKLENLGLVLSKYVKSDGKTYFTSDLPIAEVKNFFTSDVIDECTLVDDPDKRLSQTNGIVQVQSFGCRWKSITIKTKLNLIRHLTEKYIGPSDVLIDLQIADSDEIFAKNILAQVEKFSFEYSQPGATDAARSAKGKFRFLEVDTNNQELIVVEAVKIIKLLINLEDTLRY